MPDRETLRLLAKDFRQNPTKAEDALWEHLRARRCHGLKFRRQHPVKDYIVDFYCHEHRLVVEVDGGVHQDRQQRIHDGDRDSNLRLRGYSVLRFTNREVLADVEGVLRSIGAMVARLRDVKL